METRNFVDGRNENKYFLDQFRNKSECCSAHIFLVFLYFISLRAVKKRLV